ncbi:imelysin family protein [Candidatus Synechococcus spongiarum]|uniref:imelysin family protein n=1 Tax=Candidatus Synechococcus spongiarum TaxID=431041 RepID=UPI0009420177|nr:imelysin family protein [Candidatus Synechococcus spongiarum]
MSSTFVEDLVLPSYTALAQESQVLKEALQTLANEPTDAHLAAARQQWVEARPLWEVTESWAFGPAETEGLDGDLDDWPVSVLELEQALATDSFMADTFSQLGTTSIGFHGIEFVLYGDDNALPPATDLTLQQTSYLALAGDAFHDTAEQLLSSWTGADGFGATLKSDPEGTVLEMIEGAISTLEEVHLEKLGAVLEDGPEGLESRFSGTTNADIVANVSGAQNVFEDTGLKQLLAAKDADLAQQLSDALAMSVSAAEAMPSMLSQRLDDPAVRQSMEATIEATESAFNLMTQARETLDSF